MRKMIISILLLALIGCNTANKEWWYLNPPPTPEMIIKNHTDHVYDITVYHENEFLWKSEVTAFRSIYTPLSEDGTYTVCIKRRDEGNQHSDIECVTQKIEGRGKFMHSIGKRSSPPSKDILRMLLH